VTRAQLDQLVERIAAGIRVLRTLHGVTVSEDQVFERGWSWLPGSWSDVGVTGLAAAGERLIGATP
jgi:hypothetical protein